MTPAEALITAFERAGGRSLIIRVGSRPHVIMSDGAIRDIGSTEMTAAAVYGLMTELVPEGERGALHRDHHLVRTLTSAVGSRYTLTVTYDGGYFLRLEREAQPFAAPRRGDAAAERDAEGESTRIDAPSAEAIAVAATATEVSPPSSAKETPYTLNTLIASAAAAGATHLYVRAGHAPTVRVAEGVRPLPGRPLSRDDVQALLATLQDHGGSASARGIQRVDVAGTTAQVSTFTDVAGTGITARLHAASVLRRIMADLPRLARDICAGMEGLAVVAAPTRRELLPILASMSSWIAEHRAVHLISLERDPDAAINAGVAFISQRSVGSSEDRLANSLRAAATEAPDVIVVEEIRGADVLDAAIAVAREGGLVIAGVHARDSVDALQQLVRSAAGAEQAAMASALTAVWRGAFSRRLLPQRAGGRISICDTLLPTPPVIRHLTEQDFGGIRNVQSLGGRGMRSLNEALARVVHRRQVAARVAAACATDRPELAAALRNRRRRQRGAVMPAEMWVPVEAPVLA